MKPNRALSASRSAIQDGSKVLFRALGLSLIVAGFRSLRHLSIGRGYSEPTKVAIRQNRTIALLRALIHIAPVSVAIWEIVLNWNTYFVGSEIRNLAYYQFAAKIHEMTAQASLAAIIFSFVRFELSIGAGLPFGALFAGLQISQASYLWSMEFWGSICSKHLPLRRKIALIAVVTVSIVLAATVGPSSAILLVPRLGYWPAGSTHIWLNATFQDMWPDRTNGSLIPASCLFSENIEFEKQCPASRWESIQTYLTTANHLLPSEYQSSYGVETLGSIEVAGQQSLRQLSIKHQVAPGENESGYDSEVPIATLQQAAIADALSSAATLWNLALTNVTTRGHGSVLESLDSIHSIDNGYYQPLTIASCESDVIRGRDDNRSVAFPPPPGSLPFFSDSSLNTTNFTDTILPGHAFVFPNLTRSEIMATPGPPHESRLKFVELPQDPFNGTAIGAIVLLPRSSENTTQEMLMCNIGAGWGTSILNLSTSAGAAQGVQSLATYLPSPTGSKDYRGNIDASGPESTANTWRVGQFVFPYYPGRHIMVTEDWAQYLNPSLPHQNTTVFNTLMSSNLTAKDVSVSASIILAGLVANGLASIGSTSQLQGQVKTIINQDGSTGLDGGYWFSGKGDVFEVDPVESKDWIKLRVQTTFEGYSYNTRGRIPKIAIGFLLAYCMVALVHVLYAGISGMSSTCWDSIPEVTALAMNSTPTTALRNTCAGITELNIFKLAVRVLAFRDAEGEGEHLELVFGGPDEKDLENKTIKANRVYGTMPSTKTHEKVA